LTELTELAFVLLYEALELKSTVASAIAATAGVKTGAFIIAGFIFSKPTICQKTLKSLTWIELYYS